MGRKPWGVAVLVVGGAVIGIAVAGVPSRGQDPPLRVDASESTTIPSVEVTTSTTTTTTTTLLPTTSTTRARR